jgi:hypothetical protein
VNIIFSRQTHNWLKKYNVCYKSLKDILKYLCYKEGYPSNKTLHVHIRCSARDSEFDISRNEISVGIDTYSKNKNSKVRRMVRNLLHELRHFIQYKIKHKKIKFQYSYKDMINLSDRYWYAPEEIDARRYEVKKLNFVIKKLRRT